jgi:signal transduction histidine kinase
VKRRKKPAPRRASSPKSSGPVERLRKELKEAREQQAATAEILRVIASSPTSLEPVFETILANATRLCEASLAALWRYDGTNLVHGAAYNASPAFVEFIKNNPQAPSPEGPARRAAFERRTVQVLDLLNDPSFNPRTLHVNEQARTVLAVPLLRHDELVGVIILWRRTVRAFTDEQVALLQTFADQAVIAIENVRLFSDLQRSNAEITEALEQQTATTEILRVISRTQVDIQPVFDIIARSALTLCDAITSHVFRYDGAIIHIGAGASADEVHTAMLSRTFPAPVDQLPFVGRVVKEGRIFTVGDVDTDPVAPPGLIANARAAGIRSLIAVPMMRDGAAIGAIIVGHRQVDRFTDAQRSLLETFADQAVIAIENVRLFTELRQRTAQLQVANQHKDEFLASMSHELRTPLNSIIGFSEVMLQRMFGDINEKQEEYLNDVLTSGRHLLSLINDILDLSKIEAGKMELEIVEFDVPTAIDNALTLMRERAARRGQTLERVIDPRLGSTRGDERKFKQVLLNLLSNAVKFTAEGGQITVTAALTNGDVTISVTDTGVGIAPEHHELVFEEFRQVGNADKKAEGTGLGLALCRKFVELHGGRISVTSELGKGSTFTFTIPVAGLR